tara:strand:- start:32 stop:964 length:933 start_codon:yes stop_codon:yes gene_type:complete
VNISSESIKKKVIELGFQKVGITDATETISEQNNLRSWLKKNNHADMKWMENRSEERGNIHKYFPEARSVISVGMNYYTGIKQENLKSDYKFSNYAWGDDYHLVLKKQLLSLLNWIKEIDPKVKGVVCVDTSPVMDKVWAQKAGLGWIGKHTNLISRDYGSWLFLGELILDQDLKTDALFNDDLCGTCIACIEACPTQALNEYEIDARKCISYLTIEHRGPFTDDQEHLNEWIYGCDICQEVCPWNEKFSIKTEKKEFQIREEILNYENSDWDSITEEKYRKIFKKSSAKRTKYSGLKRNIQQNKNQHSE